MRDYGRVYGTFWSSQTTGNMGDDGKLLALYLMTCSHSTIAGVFRLPDGYVAEDLGWPSERVRRGFEELFDKGFANRCETTKWVWVNKHLEWNKPENPNQRKSAAKIAQGIPQECCWKLDFMRVCGESLGLELPVDVNPSETVAKGFLNQKQEQEQNSPSLRSGEEGADAPPPPPAPAKPSKPKREECTLAAFLANCRAQGVKPVPEDHAIRRWAADAGISDEMLQIAWIAFRERYTDDAQYRGKRYRDWAGHFANSVKDSWFGLWYRAEEGGDVQWTSKGLLRKQALDARHAAQQGGADASA